MMDFCLSFRLFKICLSTIDIQHVFCEKSRNLAVVTHRLASSAHNEIGIVSFGRTENLALQVENCGRNLDRSRNLSKNRNTAKYGPSRLQSK